MKTLGTNAIRIYHVDPDADHSGCMAAFAAAGIYTLIDVDTFNSYILPVCLRPSLCPGRLGSAVANTDAEYALVE